VVTTYGISVRNRFRNTASCGNPFVWDKNPVFRSGRGGSVPYHTFPAPRAATLTTSTSGMRRETQLFVHLGTFVPSALGLGGQYATLGAELFVHQ
jgi:hypothetical protein